MAVIKTFSGGGPQGDGVQLGQTGEKIGFSGATPVAKQAVAKAAGANPTAEEFDALIDALVALGLISEDTG